MRIIKDFHLWKPSIRCLNKNMYLLGLYYFIFYLKLAWIPDMGNISATELIYDLLHAVCHHWHLWETRICQDVFCKIRQQKRIQEYYQPSSFWTYRILQTFNSRNLISLIKEEMQCHCCFLTLSPEFVPIYMFSLFHLLPIPSSQSFE